MLSYPTDSMEAAALCMTSLMNMLLLVAEVQDSSAEKVGGPVILVSPAVPVMEGETVTLQCKAATPSSSRTADFYKNNILINTSDTGSMTIYNVSKSDGGLYKCNMSGAGESQENRLVIQAGVILESPLHPVTEGESVTLRCRINKNPRKCIADFYKGGLLISTGYTGELTIHAVSRSDQGTYKCSISGLGESAERWLTVAISVVLESPILLVMKETAVSLQCKSNMTSNTTADFYKDGLFIGRSLTGSLAIRSMSRSDEGLYKCNISTAEFAESGHLCSDQVLLYFFLKTPASILCAVLLLLVLRKYYCWMDEDD